MKRTLTIFLSLILTLSLSAALADYGSYQYDGSLWEGSMLNGLPNGFGILTYADGTLSIGLMRDGMSQGAFAEMPYLISSTEDVKEDFYLTIGQMTDNQWDGTFYYYTPSGMWQQTIYSLGVPISRTRVNVDGSVTEFAFKEGQWRPDRQWTAQEIQGTIFAAGPMMMYLPQTTPALDLHFYNVDTQTSGGGIYFGPGLYGMPDTVYSYRNGYSDMAISGSLPNGVFVEGRLLAGQYHGIVRVTQADGSISYEERANPGFTNAMLHEGIAQATPFFME
ncbi:MAG: hypothetical protein AB9880_12515 [Christensenellales bacterium]